MAVTKDQVRHLGWLARIDLSEDEVERNTRHIEKIIKYLDVLDSVSLSQTDPIYIKKDISGLREDDPKEFGADPLGTNHRKDGYVKGPRMT
jgi:aspartyl-tRNA(Asn)/glutamyl-tRNA(Gln) amidotransferase subunit C